MIDYAPLTRKQSDYIRASRESWLNVAEGGKRAGKNIINLLAFAIALEESKDRIHLAAGVSKGAAEMNIIDSDGFGLEWIFAGRCRRRQYNNRDALEIQTKNGTKYVIIAGGGDARSASLIKGNSYGTAYITEVNEVHRTFFQEVIDRTLASSKRQLFFDLNPKPPAHWFYADFLDYQDTLKTRGENPGYNYAHFTIADNKSISAETMKEVLSKYDKASLWYQRDILGLRTSATGRIYTGYKYDEIAIPADKIRKLNFRELSVGVDVGGTDATVATLTGITDDRKVVHIDGLYHKQSIDEKMSESVYCGMIANWLAPWALAYPRIGTIYVDSANKLFRQGLKNELIRRGMNRFNVEPFDKKDGILQRIEFTSMLIAQDRYKVASHLKKWHEALQMASWSEKDYEHGEWVRVDDGSYPVDCLDSAEYSYYSLKRYL